MRVAINACVINEAQSGVKNRFVSLFTHVFKQNPEIQYTIYDTLQFPLPTLFDELPPQIQFIHTHLSSTHTIKRYLNGSFYWKNQLKSGKYHVFENSYFPLIQNVVNKTLVTIHDLRYIQFPEFYSMPRNYLSRKIIRSGIQKSDAVITVSESMKNEILNFVPGTDVTVIPNALPIMFGDTHGIDVDSSNFQNGIPSEYILSVGHQEKRKNYINLLHAYLLLRGKGLDIPLIIVGQDADDTVNIRKFIYNNKLNGKISIYTKISDKQLAILYKNANLFVFPSKYEGFGIPLLEAMHYKVPYVVSDLTVFKEITDQKAHYFNPSKPQEIADMIWQILHDEEKRNALVQLGSKCLKKYQWGDIAQLYSKLLYRLYD